jgi:hypothetical protein
LLPALELPPNVPGPDLGRRRVVRLAAASLLVFSVVTSIALVAWFWRAEQPWSWRSTLAILGAAGGLAACVAVWRKPSRVTVLSGIGVMVVSLLRVGLPSDWTTASWVLFLLTAILIAPVARLALAIR